MAKEEKAKEVSEQEREYRRLALEIVVRTSRRRWSRSSSSSKSSRRSSRTAKRIFASGEGYQPRGGGRRRVQTKQSADIVSGWVGELAGELGAILGRFLLHFPSLLLFE